MRLVSVVASLILLTGCGQTVTTVTINQAVFTVAVADEPAEQALGLGDTATLEPNQGMVFLFPDSQVHTFWMKDVEYPIDIIWINENKVIGSVTAYPGSIRYSSPESVNMVLEVPAGTVASKQIGVGDRIEID